MSEPLKLELQGVVSCLPQDLNSGPLEEPSLQASLVFLGPHSLPTPLLTEHSLYPSFYSGLRTRILESDLGAVLASPPCRSVTSVEPTSPSSLTIKWEYYMPRVEIKGVNLCQAFGPVPGTQ